MINCPKLNLLINITSHKGKYILGGILVFQKGFQKQSIWFSNLKRIRRFIKQIKSEICNRPSTLRWAHFKICHITISDLTIGCYASTSNSQLPSNQVRKKGGITTAFSNNIFKESIGCL